MTTGTRPSDGSRRRRADRMLAVLRTLDRRGAVALADLAAEFAVSAATLRRDLADLEDRGLLVRTHGGARTAEHHDEVPVQFRDLEATEAKHRIAIRAAELIPSGRGAVSLSGGSTAAGVARALRRRQQLTIVTNSLTVAVELAVRPTAKVVLTGGVVRSASLEAVGVLAETAFRAIDVGTAVVGVDGLTASSGATVHDESEARTNRTMIEHARRVMIVADGSKVGRVASAVVVDAAGIDVLVTDASADPDELRRLRRAGVAVDVVGSGR